MSRLQQLHADTCRHVQHDEQSMTCRTVSSAMLLDACEIFAGEFTQHDNNDNNLQAFQLIVLARYLLGVPNPSPVSQHTLT